MSIRKNKTTSKPHALALTLRSRLANRDKWCQYHRLLDGRRCVVGHLDVVLGYKYEWETTENIRAKLALQDEVLALIGFTTRVSAIHFNDQHSHEAILAYIDSNINTWKGAHI